MTSRPPDREQWDRAYAEAPEVLEVVPDPRLVEAVGGRVPGRALELGCGEGRPAVWLAWLGWEVTAVDLSPVAVDRGRRIAAAHEVEVTWVVDDVADAVLPEALDLVVVSYLHVAPEVLHAALRRAARALRLGGTVIVIGWDRASGGEGSGGPHPPELRYDPDELRDALAGLDVTAERVPQERGGPVLDLLVRAVRR